jgi:hypothetical protein
MIRDLQACTTLAALLAALVVPAIAFADVELSATEVRNYDLPSDFELGQAQIQSTRDGTTVLSMTIGDETNAACTVLVANGADATSFSYQYQGGPTACVGVLAHPDGGFFVRGAKADAEEGDVFGFSARIDAQGNEMWALPDQQLVDDSDFLGEYLQPHPELAYSPDSNKLLGFTTAGLNIGAEQVRLAQAHVLGAADGRLKENAKTFGNSGSAGFVAGTTTRTSDGDFLLYIYDAGSQGAHFFTYDGRISISKFEPLDQDWSRRYVRQMIYGPDDNVHLLWTPETDTSAPTNVTVVDDTAAEVWTASWPSTIDNPEGGEPVALGTPLGMWVGADYSLVLYNTGQQLMLRVADAATGENLGVAALSGLTDHAPQAILNGADGSLKLLALNAAGDQLHELRLDISVQAGDGDAGGDPGADAGPADASAGSGGGDEGCATSAPGDPAPVSTAVLAFLFLVFTIAPRTRFARLPKGDHRHG